MAWLPYVLAGLIIGYALWCLVRAVKNRVFRCGGCRKCDECRHKTSICPSKKLHEKGKGF